MQIPDNHHQHQEKRRTAVTIRLKRENRPYHLGGNQKEEQLFSSGGESLGIRNSSGNQEKRKIDSGPKKDNNWFCIKLTLFFFFSFAQIWQS